MPGGQYNFRPVAESDFPMLRRWLQTPDVTQWWGDPDHELGLIRQDLEDRRVVGLIVSLDDTPFAYAQHYDVHDWPQAHMLHLAPGTRAVDTFVGVPDMLGAGHGAAYLHALAAGLLEDGAAGVVIDPDIKNARARRAFEKAGFSKIESHRTKDGAAIVMHFVPDDGQAR